MQKLFPLIFIIAICVDPIFPIMNYWLNLGTDGIIYKTYLVVTASIIFLTSYFCNRKNNVDYIPLVLGLTIFGFLYYLTSIYYEAPNKYHLGHFLRWGVSCVPAVFMGIATSNYQWKDGIAKYLPIPIILLVPIIASISLLGAQEYGQFVDEESGLNYQLISYYMAYFFAIITFYLFIDDNIGHKPLFLKMIMCGMMLVSGIICTISGGRGGLVLLCVYILFLLYIMHRNETISKNQIILLVIISAVLFIFIANYFDLWNYAGFKRATNPLDQQTGRKDDWQEVISYFYCSPLWGNGLGSDFYTWGFYSHNIFVDFLAETGLIGFYLFSYIFYWVGKTIFRQSRTNIFYVLIMIIALYGFVMNCFSGYWISAWQNWFAFGVAFGIRCQKKMKIMELSHTT